MNPGGSRKPFGLGAPGFGLIAVGGLGIATQLVLLRELLASFGGNEFVAGITIAGWVLFEAVGAWIAGRSRLDNLTPLAVVSVLTSLAAVPAAVVARSLFGALPGETASIPVLLATSAAIALLPAATHGMLFVAATGRLADSRTAEGAARDDENPVGLGYAWEGAGTAAAGVACYFLLNRLPGLAVVALFAAPLLISLLALSERSVSGRIAVLVTLVVTLAAFAAAMTIDHLAWAVAWRGQHVDSVGNTPYGKIVTLRRSDQRLVLYNGIPVASAPVTDPVRTGELALLPLLLHPGPRSVLFLGSDLAVAATAARSFPTCSVQTVLLDSALWATAARALSVDSSLAPGLVRVVRGDPGRYLSTTGEEFDCIVLTDAAPATLSANRSFCVEFYRLCRKRLRAGGLLASPAPGDPTALTPSEAGHVATRVKTLEAAFPGVTAIAADFPLVLASETPIDPQPREMTSRLAALGRGSGFLDSSYVMSLLDPFRREALLSAIAARPGRSMTRTGPPTELFLTMARENRLAAPRFGRLYEKVGQTNPRLFWLLVGLLAAAAVAGAAVRGARFGRGFGILTSGAAGTALVALSVFGYEARFGSVYSGISLLVTAFILGTVGGGLLGVYFSRHGWLGVPFLVADLVLAAGAAALLVLAESGPGTAFLAVNFLAGAALGVQYSIAGSTGPARRRAGQLAALDLVGGFAGGALLSLFVTPVFGVSAAATVVVAAKLASAAAQLAGGRFLDSAGRSPRMAA